ncbi:MAG TPA: ADOP family duplicated permease [Gemmatimonadaceae bacterium]|nr:ADOP family duplicated permease [Gemmatimonadaceae bacterium]
MLTDLRYRLRTLFSRASLERELDDELRFHLEQEAEKYMRQGKSREEAERLARVAFGGVERIKDDTRDAHGLASLDRVAQDLRYAWRAIRNRPGFSAAIVLTLGLGIGANAAMFGIVDRLLFRPPPYLENAARVQRVFVNYVWDSREQTDGALEYARFTNLAEWTSSFDLAGVAAYRDVAIGTGDAAREMRIAVVSATLFDFFDATPVLGRFFSKAEDRPPAGAPVAVLSYEYWQLGYGGAADAIGRSVQVDRAVYTIIGVAPPEFVGITDERAPAMFIPATAFAATRRPHFATEYGWSWLDMFVRRKPGVSVESANADLTAAYRRSWEAERATGNVNRSANDARARAFVAPVHESRGPTAGPEAKVAAWVMGVACIVLLVACANVANLLLARAVSRRREIALRLALGVTRWRLTQQLLTETLLLAVFGAVAGLVVAQAAGTALRALILGEAARDGTVVDPRTLVFVGAVALGVAVLTGLAPALQAVRPNVADALKAGTREGTHHRSTLRSMLLLFQGAFSLVLLVGAGLFVRSLAHVRAERLGYDVRPVIYAEGMDRGVQLSDAEARALQQRLLSAALSEPGVVSASPTISVPFWSSEGRGAPHVPGRDSLQKLGRFMLQAGSPEYFATVGTRIVRGHGFTAADNETAAPVVVVSESMARAVWPDQEAIGRIMRIGSDTNPYMTVIGVAEDIRSHRLQGAPEFTYYMPIAQYIRRFGDARPALFIRVQGDAADRVEAIRRRLQREMPGASYMKAMPLAALVAPQQRSWEFGATMFVAFGALALALAAIGLYSVVTYAVAQRSHELGVRIALGAGTDDVVGLVVKQGVRFALGGILIGSAIALAAGKALEAVLFKQSPRDPSVFIAVAGVLLVVAVAATLRPALRAARVDPMVALRAD